MAPFPPASAELGDLQTAVDARLAELDRERWNERLWSRDHTLWKPDPTEITDRLGWLEAPEWIAGELRDLERFAAEVASDGVRDVVLLGMGGSSLAPEVIARTFGAANGRPRLWVLDTTDPATILGVEEAVDLSRTLFVVASKSGGTIETLSQFAYFFEKSGGGRQFVAITDPGSGLERLAQEKGFRRTFLNPPDIGGRYSALSYFGMAPAALVGAPVGAIVEQARQMAAACGPGKTSSENPGAWLGAVLGESARSACRDKLTLLSDGPITGFGDWAEQLIAESTGKEGVGILPVVGEPEGAPSVYGADRLFVTLGQETPLRPALTVPVASPEQLGAEFFRWEYATAVAGAVLGIQPFDQPNVQEAKDATNRILAAGRVPPPQEDDLDSLLDTVLPGDYIAITAFVGRTAEHEQLLQDLRVRLRDKYGVATTLGFGPRFLHSTGQLHKGGPDTGVFIQVVQEDLEDVPIPGKPYTFGTLKAAQALGDYESLRARGRRVARVRLATLVDGEIS